MHFSALLPFVPALVSAMAIEARGSTSPRAAYMLSDDPAGCNIITMGINVDTGMLDKPKLIPTGGWGLQGINISSGTNSPNDPLFTQDAIMVSDNYLFAVNTGSHSLSLFAIDPMDPTDLTLLSVQDTLGDFPSSVAYSPDKKIACVANGGGRSGIACFSVDHSKGLTPITSLLPIGINQTQPPVGPFSTVSDIVFSPTGKYVMVSTKGASPTAHGSFHIFPVTPSGNISTSPIVSTLPEIDFFLFGFSFMSDHKIYATDAGYGGAVLTISSSFQATVESTLAVPGQVFSCWTSYAPRFDSVFLADACIPNITVVDPVTNTLKGYLYQDLGSIGSLAVKLDRNYLYVLKGISTISVTDLTGLNNARNNYSLGPESLIQTLDFSDVVERPFVSGLTIYPAFDTADQNPSC